MALRWEHEGGRVHDLWDSDEFKGHIFFIEKEGVWNFQWFHPHDEYHEEFITAEDLEEAQAIAVALMRMS